MSFILTDSGNSEHNLQINGWHWRTVLEILSIQKACPAFKIELMGINGLRTTLEKAELDAVSAALKKVTPTLASDEWIFPDGTVTKNPEDSELLNRLPHSGSYRTNRAVLELICKFC